MKNIYEECPEFENERWLLRFVEKSDALKNIMSLIVSHIFEMFDCNQVVTKIPIYAVERAAAAEAFGFEKTDSLLVAKDGVAFNGYWIFSSR